MKERIRIFEGRDEEVNEEANEWLEENESKIEKIIDIKLSSSSQAHFTYHVVLFHLLMK